MDAITAGRKKYAEWFALTGHDELFTEAYDGLKLHAILLRHYPEDHRWFVPVHGYLRNSLDMLGPAGLRPVRGQIYRHGLAGAL